VGARLAEMVATYKIAINNMKHVTAELTASLYAKEVPKAEVPTRVKESVAYQEADAELVRVFAMKTLLEAHYRAYEKQASALSRLISLRELEFQQTLRQEGVRKPVKPRFSAAAGDLRKRND